MRDGGAQGSGLHLLKTNHVGERGEICERSGDAIHRGRRARETTRSVAEVTDVVGDDPNRMQRSHRVRAPDSRSRTRDYGRAFTWTDPAYAYSPYSASF